MKIRKLKRGLIIFSIFIANLFIFPFVKAQEVTNSIFTIDFWYEKLGMAPQTEIQAIIIAVCIMTILTVIIHEIMHRFAGFNFGISFVIAISITLIAVLGGYAAYAIHFVMSLAAIAGAVGVFIVVIVSFLIFIGVHFGIRALANLQRLPRIRR